MVDLLVSTQRFIDLSFDWSDGPVERPLTIIFLVVFKLLDVSESIVLQRVPYDLDVVFVQVEVIAPVRSLVRSDRDRVFIWSENQKLALNLLPELWQQSPCILVLLPIALNNLLFPLALLLDLCCFVRDLLLIILLVILLIRRR